MTMSGWKPTISLIHPTPHILSQEMPIIKKFNRGIKYVTDNGPL